MSRTAIFKLTHYPEYRKNRPRHQPVPLEPAQGEGEHALGDAVHKPLDLVEALGPVAQEHDDQYAPFVADPRQHPVDALAGFGTMVGTISHLLVLRYQGCAAVPEMCVLARVSMVPILVQVTYLYWMAPVKSSKQLLHIDASILGAQSASRQLSAAVVQELTGRDPGLSVTYRDLASAPADAPVR